MALPINVTLDEPSGSPLAPGSVTNRLARGSACRFCVCIAIVLTRKMGRPSASSAYGINDPKGKPGCFRDKVERLPMRPKCINVRALSANDGSGTAGRLFVAPPACFPEDEEDIADHSLGVQPIM